MCSRVWGSRGRLRSKDLGQRAPVSSCGGGGDVAGPGSAARGCSRGPHSALWLLCPWRGTLGPPAGLPGVLMALDAAGSLRCSGGKKVAGGRRHLSFCPRGTGFSEHTVATGDQGAGGGRGHGGWDNGPGAVGTARSPKPAAHVGLPSLAWLTCSALKGGNPYGEVGPVCPWLMWSRGLARVVGTHPNLPSYLLFRARQGAGNPRPVLLISVPLGSQPGAWHRVGAP